MGPEAKIEARLVARARSAGGEALKWSSPSNRGVPDRIVLLPGGRIVFVELKAPGRVPGAQQQAWLDRLAELGFEAAWVDSLAKVDALFA